MNYLAPLDGIRAIAIIAVLIFHISPVPLRGGFTGVDVFFVLSGFLITSNILHGLSEGHFSLKEFYLRRIQRLLPNILVMLMSTLILWKLLLQPSMARQQGRHSLYTLFNLSNVYIWKNLGGYWGDSAEWSPLTHTWSLAIEEQFYLIFPFIFLLLARFQRNRIALWLTIATTFSFILCLYGSITKPSATFYLLPTRVWELLLGTLLATHISSLRPESDQLADTPNAKRLEAMGWAGIIMIVAGFIVVNETQKFPGIVALLPTVGTTLLIRSVAGAETRLSRSLSAPFMVGTGKLSYSLYLWHWPLITLGKIQAGIYGWPQLLGATAGGLIGVLLAWAAFVVVEQPLRSRGPGRSWRFALIAAGFSAVAFASSLVATQRVVADPSNRFDTPSWYGVLYSSGRREVQKDFAVTWYDIYSPPIPPGPRDSWRTGGVVHLYGGGHPKVVVFGSSHAMMYSRMIDEICRKMGISVAFLCMDWGTPAFFEAKYNPNFVSPKEAGEFDEARKKWLREWRPDHVFIIDRWEHIASTPQLFDSKLRSFLREVTPLVGSVDFVTQVPVVKNGNKFNLRELTGWHLDNQMGLPRLYPDSNEPHRKQLLATVLKAAAEFPNLHVLRADQPFYHADGSIRFTSGRAFYYADGDHLTDLGAESVRNLFQNALIKATTSPASLE